MTAEQLAAFRALVAKDVRNAIRPPKDASMSPEIERARAAFCIKIIESGDAATRLNYAAKRRAIAELQRRGIRPTETRARAVASQYVRDYVEWGMGDDLEIHVGGGFTTYAFSVHNGRCYCRIHEQREEHPGFILVNKLHLQPCCFHFPIDELRAEIAGNRVVQLSLGLAT